MNSILSSRLEDDFRVLEEDLKDFIRPVTSSTARLLLWEDLKLLAKIEDSTPESQKEGFIVIILSLKRSNWKFWNAKSIYSFRRIIISKNK